jgi:hypothetical protein
VTGAKTTTRKTAQWKTEILTKNKKTKEKKNGNRCKILGPSELRAVGGGR